MATLPKEFYFRRTDVVARDLLGKTLVRIHKGQRISGRISEVEAYMGVKDRACHSYGHRKSKRTQSMYLKGGHSYIYLIYGMHYCFNVVTRGEGVPEAVLIRALEPLDGISLMQRFRKKSKTTDLTTGPGKLATALNIQKDLDGEPLDSGVLFIETAPKVHRSKIVSKPRVGVDYAGKDAKLPLRFYLKDSIYISKK